MVSVMLLIGAGLHFYFMYIEMCPKANPKVLADVLSQRGVELEPHQLALVATIVRNAGIYNFIVATGFLVCLALNIRAHHLNLDVSTLRLFETFFFSGAVVAGIYGRSLSRKTVVQAIVGGLGLVFVALSIGSRDSIWSSILNWF